MYLANSIILILTSKNNIMKKYFLACLLLIVMAFALNSCGSGNDLCPAYTQDDTTQTEQAV